MQGCRNAAVGAHWGTRPRCASPTARGLAGCDFHASSVTRGASGWVDKKPRKVCQKHLEGVFLVRRGPTRRLCPDSRTANRLSGWWGRPAAPRSPARPLAPRLVVWAVQQPLPSAPPTPPQAAGELGGAAGKVGSPPRRPEPRPELLPLGKAEAVRPRSPALRVPRPCSGSAPPVGRRQVLSCGRGGRGGEDGVGRAPRARRPEDGCPERRGQSRARAPPRAPSRAGRVFDPAAGAAPGACLSRGYREVWPGTVDPAPKATSPSCPPPGRARGSDFPSRGNRPGGDLHQVVLLGMRSAPVPGRTFSGFSRPLGATAGGGAGEVRRGPSFSDPRPARG